MKKHGQTSIVFQILAYIFLIIALLVSVLTLCSMYFYQNIQENSMKAAQGSLKVYISNIENDLKNISEGLDEFSYSNLNNLLDLKNGSDLDRYLLSMKMKDLLNAKLLSNNQIDGFFIAYPKDGLLLSQFSSHIDGTEKIDLVQTLKERKTFSNNAVDSMWDILSVGQSYYFFRTYNISGIYIGALVRTSTVMSPVGSGQIDQDEYFLTMPDGRIIYRATHGNVPAGTNSLPNLTSPATVGKYTIITDRFSLCDIRISVAETTKNQLLGLDLGQSLILVVMVLLLVMIPLFIRYLFRSVIKPLRKLVGANRQLESGNLDFRLPPDSASSEFGELSKSFNSMATQIKNLKISSYEEKIERQKVELKFLQSQIRPHFFLNAISTISSMSLQGKNEEINRYIDVLSNHFRYLFRGGLTRVPLGNELRNADNYIRMQQIKYPDNIFYRIDADEGCSNVPVPHLVLETFVENIFKHAFTYGKMISVFIRAEHTESAGGQFVRVTINDDGCGFPPAFLQTGRLEEEPGRHIGIANIRKTLSLFYGRDDLLSLSNNETGGAQVTLLFPCAEAGEGGCANETSDC